MNHLINHPEKREWILNLIVFLSSIFLITIVEIALYLLNIPSQKLKYDIFLPFIIEKDHRGLDWRGYHTFNDRLFKIDDLLYQNEEESVFWVPKPDTYPFNSEGTIGDRTTDRCIKNRCIKILSIGDSNTLWDGESSYPFVLKEIISNDDNLNCEVRLINAGVHGYSSYQGLKYIKRFLSYRPHLVTISFGWNDTLSVKAPEDKFYAKALKRLIYQQESPLISTIRKSRIIQIIERGAIFIITRVVEPKTKHRVNPIDFEGNLREMIQLVKTNGGIPIIITRPHYFRRDKILEFEYDVDRYNEIAKRIAISTGIPMFEIYKEIST